MCSGRWGGGRTTQWRVLAAILAGARRRAKGTSTPRHISSCGPPAAHISYFKPEQICWEHKPAVPLENPDKADAKARWVGEGLGAGWGAEVNIRDTSRALGSRGQELGGRHLGGWLLAAAAAAGPRGLRQMASSTGLGKSTWKEVSVSPKPHARSSSQEWAPAARGGWAREWRLSLAWWQEYEWGAENHWGCPPGLETGVLVSNFVQLAH